MREIYEIKQNGKWLGCLDTTEEEKSLLYNKKNKVNIFSELEITSLQTGNVFKINLMEAIHNLIIEEVYHKSQAKRK